MYCTQLCAVLLYDQQHSRRVYSSISTRTRCTTTLQLLRRHQVIGIFQLLSNVMGPLSYTQSIVHQHVITCNLTHSGVAFR